MRVAPIREAWAKETPDGARVAASFGDEAEKAHRKAHQ
jgi:hypothetical protein